MENIFHVLEIMDGFYFTVNLLGYSIQPVRRCHSERKQRTGNGVILTFLLILIHIRNRELYLRSSQYIFPEYFFTLYLPTRKFFNRLNIID